MIFISTITLIFGIFVSVVSVSWGWGWMTWYWVFVVSDLADTVSTFIAVTFLGRDWSEEQNLYIQNWGPRFGYPLAVVAHTIITLVIVYVLAWLIVEPFAFWGTMVRTVIASSFIVWQASGKFIFAVLNILGSLEK